MCSNQFDRSVDLASLKRKAHTKNSSIEDMEAERSLFGRVLDHLESAFGGSKSAQSEVDASEVPIGMGTREVKIVGVDLGLT
jgi:hypothetical protein